MNEAYQFPPFLADAPPILYKYRNWKDCYNKKTLTDKAIYFASPDSFNDPFDTNIKGSYSNLSNFEKDELIDGILNYAKDIPIEEIKTFAQIPGFWEHQALAQIKIIRGIVGIFCLSAIWDSITMWSHYSNSHTGYCIGFKSRNLHYKKCGLLSKVEYVNDYPIIKSTFGSNQTVLDQMTHKSIHWAQEKEFRFIGYKYAGKIIDYDADDVEEIILGVNMQPSHKDEIRTICKKCFPHVKLFEIYLNSQKFELERRLIE